MRLKGAAVLAGVLIFSAPASYAQMMEKMDKHMEEHMGEMHKKKETKNEARGLTQEAEAAGVTVRVTYKNPGAKTPMFNVALDTHSVDLESYKFDDIVLLRDEAGGEFKPAAMEEEGSGHHREATIEFKAESPAATKTFELVVKGVAGVKERVFKFDVKGDMME